MKELDAPVEYIVLPTFAYEHKIFVGPFSRKFPRAQVWVAPRQWSWPINLPLEFFGIFRARALEDEDDSTPWADEIEQKVFSSPEVGKVPPILATSLSDPRFLFSSVPFVFYFLRKYVDFLILTSKKFLKVSNYPVRTMRAFISQETMHIFASHDKLFFL